MAASTVLENIETLNRNVSVLVEENEKLLVLNLSLKDWLGQVPLDDLADDDDLNVQLMQIKIDNLKGWLRALPQEWQNISQDLRTADPLHSSPRSIMIQDEGVNGAEGVMIFKEEYVEEEEEAEPVQPIFSEFDKDRETFLWDDSTSIEESRQGSQPVNDQRKENRRTMKDAKKQKHRNRRACSDACKICQRTACKKCKACLSKKRCSRRMCPNLISKVEGKVVCQQCRKVFSSRHVLTRHLKEVCFKEEKFKTPQAPKRMPYTRLYVCDLDNLRFESNEEVGQHLYEHDGLQAEITSIYKCTVCDFECEDQVRMRSHVSKMHPEQVKQRSRPDPDKESQKPDEVLIQRSDSPTAMFLFDNQPTINPADDIQ